MKKNDTLGEMSKLQERRWIHTHSSCRESYKRQMALAFIRPSIRPSFQSQTFIEDLGTMPTMNKGE